MNISNLKYIATRSYHSPVEVSGSFAICLPVSGNRTDPAFLMIKTEIVLNWVWWGRVSH